MDILVCKEYEEMSHRAAELAADCVREAPEGLFSFPGGDTPLGMVRQFVQMVNAGEVDITRARYVMLDEWVGLGREDKGSCADFTYTHLLDPMGPSFAQTHIINGRAANIEAERQALEKFLYSYGPLTLSVLGIGMNGHLGFNEDGVDFGKDTLVIPLAPVTKEVMGKYFGGDVNPEFGISIGIAQLMKARRVVLIANGAKKAEIVAKAAHGPVSPQVPASVLQKHPNCTFVLDEAAAALL